MNYKILLCYRKSDWPTREFIELVHYLSVSNRPDFILGDFNMKPSTEFEGLLGDYTQEVFVAGSTLDHVYVRIGFKYDKTVYVEVKSIFFSDHEMISIEICQ